jgi:hypothetical protein
MATRQVAATPQQAPMRYLQGIAVPAESVNPVEFFRRTRRHTMVERTAAYAGLGGSDLIELKKADIIAGIWVKFSGTLTTAVGTGAVATTRRWPYDLLRTVRFTANGQSNIINCSGLKLKAREFMARDARSDRGVSQTVGAATVTQGTLSDASEAWGVGSAQTGITDAARAVELRWFIPVAEDQVHLPGAIFAQTSSTDLTLTLDWNTLANLFVLTGTATAALTGTLTVESIKYSIPVGPNGEIVVPDLSVFHSLIQSSTASLAAGDNEVRIVGQGAGKTLLRAFFQVWNGAAPQVPLAMTAANFGRQAWRYAGNETPDEYVDGQMLREINEATYNSDVGAVWGFGSHDFAAENAFRDAVDMGTASELRLFSNLQAALTAPSMEHVVETIFAAGAGA